MDRGTEPYTLQSDWDLPSVSWVPSEDEGGPDLTAFTDLEQDHSLSYQADFSDHSNPLLENTISRPNPTHPHLTHTSSQAVSPSSPRFSEPSLARSSPSLSVIKSASPSAQSDGISSFVDLTDESEIMAPSKRRAKTGNKQAARGLDDAGQPSKRRKVEAKPESIEEVDLRDVDSDSDLSKVLEQQRAATIKDQQEGADQPSKLAKVTCVICMEELTNVTATHCGHLFCHTCLMEALIAGENQGGDPGKGQSKCPICRKRVKRPKDSNDVSNVIPLEIKVSTKSRALKGKGRA